MKRFIVIILALLYITTTIGANINLHYCMGELADVELGQAKSKTCGFCGMEKGDEKDNGCCKDEQKFIKNETDQKFVEFATYIFKVLGATEVPAFTVISIIKASIVTEQNPLSNAPPRCNGQAIYIRNRSFLI